MEKRKRLCLRPLYMEFILRIGIEDFHNIENKIKAPSSLAFQRHLLERFNKIHMIDLINHKIRLDQERKQKFNSAIFIELEVEKRQLSVVMREFKNMTLIKFGDYTSFEMWLDSNTKENIDNEIRMYINEL